MATTTHTNPVIYDAVETVVEAPGTEPRTPGKAVRVLDER
jgi:hypothetical protein